MTSSSNSDTADASTPRPALTSSALPDPALASLALAATPPDEPPSEQEVADLEKPSSALALFTVFRHRNYRLFFSGQLVSLMGTWMQSVAQGWLVYSLTHSPFLLGLTVVLRAGDGVLHGAVRRRDRRPRRPAAHADMDAEPVDGAGDPARGPHARPRRAGVGDHRRSPSGSASSTPSTSRRARR